jgi:hypothetical protein
VGKWRALSVGEGAIWAGLGTLNPHVSQVSTGLFTDLIRSCYVAAAKEWWDEVE